MRALGYCLIVIGVIYLLIAFNMDVSVAAASNYIPGYGNVGGGEVANLDLMARRQNHLFVAALITLSGVLMAIFGAPSGTVDEEANVLTVGVIQSFAGERDLTSDPYRLWLASFYNISKNEVFDRFVIGETTFATLAAALAHAHGFELEKIEQSQAKNAQRLADDEQRKENAQALAEQAEAEWQEMKPKVVVGTIMGVAAIFVAMLVFSESSEEKAARLAKEVSERARFVESVEERFGISLPKDAFRVEVTENAASYDFICNGKADGNMLNFFTNEATEDVKNSISKNFGKGKPVFESLSEKFDWTWVHKGNHYQLTILNDTSPADVRLCMTSE